jgi:indolepyruvate decarboxylase
MDGTEAFTATEIDKTALTAPGYYAGMGFRVPAGIGVAAITSRLFET